MESNQVKRKKRRIKKPETVSTKLRRTVKRQLGKNEEGEYQWEIIIGVVLAVVLVVAFIVYVYLNVNRVK